MGVRSLALLGEVPNSSTNWAVLSFLLYIGGVLLLAWFSNRSARSRAFLSEYFLGSRSLGVWAFALTFAATSASGGSFIGFPALVYSHGWIAALWIGGYMIVPLIAMGLLGRRLNQVARLSQAITIPDVLRDRFNSPLFGMVATGLIVFFMIFNLVAQFKGGSVILQSLLQDEPIFQRLSHSLGAVASQVPFMQGAADQPGYLLCLLVFAGVVIVYTTYGGFRAVVWTDVMQGVVMLCGVMILLPLTIWAVGGLGAATQEMARMTPPQNVLLQISSTLDQSDQNIAIPKNTWLVDDTHGKRRVFRTKKPSTIDSGQDKTVSNGNAAVGTVVEAIELTYDKHVQQVKATPLSERLWIEVVQETPYAAGAGVAGAYVYGPGPDEKNVDGFLPLALAVSFFFMWTFSGAGQPSNMIRLMAFDSTRTLRRAMFTVSIYYTLIYFPLVIIFCCSRVLLPGWETEPDRIMPEVAKVTSNLIQMPWLAGLLVAAPFAAVMSTMDSFLLMISSGVVRDIYQRNVNPQASEKTLKRMTYLTTLVVGCLAMAAAINPPKYLQDIIVFTGTGLSTAFLVPVFLMLYWPRFNLAGALSSMLVGFCSFVALYAIGTLNHPQFQMTPFQLGGFHPFLIAIVVSLSAAIAATLCTAPPSLTLSRKYFGKQSADH